MFRGLEHWERVELQQQKHCDWIAEVATKKGIDLAQIGITLPCKPGAPREYVQSLINSMKFAEAEKRRKTREGRKVSEAEAKAEVATIPEDATKLALIKKIQELAAQNATLNRMVGVLRGQANHQLVYFDAQIVAQAMAAESPFHEENDKRREDLQWHKTTLAWASNGKVKQQVLRGAR